MSIEYREGYSDEWAEQILAVHNKTDMKRSEQSKDILNRAFAASYAVATAWVGPRLIACGRMISDGQMYSGIFDVVVDPEFQKCGVGREIMNRLIVKAPQTCIHLTSTFGNEPFYRKIGFKKHKTAMALYPERIMNSPYLES